MTGTEQSAEPVHELVAVLRALGDDIEPWHLRTKSSPPKLTIGAKPGLIKGRLDGAGYLHSARESRRSTAGVNRVICVVDFPKNRKCKGLCRCIVAQPTLNNQVPPNPENPSGTACEGNRNRRTDCGSGIGVTAGWHSQCFVGSRTCKHPTQRDSTRGKPRRSRRGGCHTVRDLGLPVEDRGWLAAWEVSS